MKLRYAFLLLFPLWSTSCKKETGDALSQAESVGRTLYAFRTPDGFPTPTLPANNVMTVEGVELGKKLFFDPILSGNNAMTCASCHFQEFAFTDTARYSAGITGALGFRNSMTLFNLAWAPQFFWDGGASDLESQVLGPITSDIEMHRSMVSLVSDLNADAGYRSAFKKAFGVETIESMHVMKALAQFMRTMVSADSRYDRYLKGEASLNDQEILGMQLYSNPQKGACASCHVLGGLFTDFGYRNTGLDLNYSDLGRGRITLQESDMGKFKTPSLRNIALTAPYMHDGRFTTLEQCVQHYNSGFQAHPNLDPVLAALPQNRLSTGEMQAIVAFLGTLTDTTFIHNSKYQAP